MKTHPSRQDLIQHLYGLSGDGTRIAPPADPNSDIARHIATCPHCQAEVSKLSATLGQLDALKADARAPQALVDQTLRALRNQEHEPGRLTPRWTWITAGVMALLLVTLVIPRRDNATAPATQLAKIEASDKLAEAPQPQALPARFRESAAELEKTPTELPKDSRHELAAGNKLDGDRLVKKLEPETELPAEAPEIDEENEPMLLALESSAAPSKAAGLKFRDPASSFDGARSKEKTDTASATSSGAAAIPPPASAPVPLMAAKRVAQVPAGAVSSLGYMGASADTSSTSRLDDDVVMLIKDQQVYTLPGRTGITITASYHDGLYTCAITNQDGYPASVYLRASPDPATPATQINVPAQSTTNFTVKAGPSGKE